MAFTPCVGVRHYPERITREPAIEPHWLPGGPPVGPRGKGICPICIREVALTLDGRIGRHKAAAS